MSKIYSVLHFCSPFFWRRSRIHLPALLAQGILNWTSPDSQVSLPPYPRARTTLFLKLSCLSELSHPLRPSSIPLRPTGLLQFPGIRLTCSEKKAQLLPILMALLQSLWSQMGTLQADFNFSPWNTEFGHKFKTSKQTNKTSSQTT